MINSAILYLFNLSTDDDKFKIILNNIPENVTISDISFNTKTKYSGPYVRYESEDFKNDLNYVTWEDNKPNFNNCWTDEYRNSMHICQHKWNNYVGLIEKYQYCVKCNERKN